MLSDQLTTRPTDYLTNGLTTMFEMTNEISGYLAPNERVLWQGQGKRRLNATSAGGALFIAMFVAFALILGVFFVASASSSRAQNGDAAALVILPIILVAVGLSVVVPLLVMGRRTSNARYFVTTAAAILLYPPAVWSGRRVTIVPLKNLSQITFNENRDGTGTLTFGQNLVTGYGGRYSNSGWADSTPAFSNIERPTEVYQLIRQQMSAER
jgi:hypothetical protein